MTYRGDTSESKRSQRPVTSYEPTEDLEFERLEFYPSTNKDYPILPSKLVGGKEGGNYTPSSDQSIDDSVKSGHTGKEVSLLRHLKSYTFQVLG